MSACSPGSSGSTRTADVSLAALPKETPVNLAAYYGQSLSWRECGVSGFECTTMKAPLDYAEPDAGDIKLAVARKKATGPGKRLGSLLVNPGGPGGSAIGYLQSYAGLGYPAAVRARYDMVAVDPRGVARSEPVECLSGKQMDAYTQTDVTPDDQAETNELSAAFKKFAAGCEAKSGEVLPHVSTVEAARDMDILRAALGDDKLNYVGASYGTFLGATYAGLYPGAGRPHGPGRRDGPVSVGARDEPRRRRPASRRRSSRSRRTAYGAPTAPWAPGAPPTRASASSPSSPNWTAPPSPPVTRRAASSARPSPRPA